MSAKRVFLLTLVVVLLLGGAASLFGHWYPSDQHDAPAFLTLPPDPEDWVLAPAYTELDYVSVSWDDTVHIFDLSGTKLSDQRAALDGRPVDMELFRQIYTTLTGARALEPLGEDGASDAACMTLRFVYRNADKPDDELVIFESDGRLTALLGDGTGYVIQARFVEDVRDALASVS